MTFTHRISTTTLFTLAIAAVCVSMPQAALAQSSGLHSLAEAAQQKKFAFILFYRSNDNATKAMYNVLNAELARRNNAMFVPVNITDPQEQAVIEQFDASRTPMPAVMAVAPNGAITGVFAQKLTAAQVGAAIVTPAQTQCMRALQDKKLVLLCVQPTGRQQVPAGVQQFKADKLNVNRTHLVSLQAGDPAEAKFLQQLKVRPDTRTTVTAFMAPPGVLLGTFNENVSHDVLMKKLVAAGQCCDDPNCKHGKSGTAVRPRTRR